MGEKENAGLTSETRTTAQNDQNEDLAAEPQTQPEQGGRPQKSELKPFVIKQVLQIYVSFLRTSAPQHWNDRRINFELFSPEIQKDQRTQRSPTNAMGALPQRLSMPKLRQGERISDGIFRAETNDMFRGGFQILFHPYIRMLSIPTQLEEIRSLLALCGCTQSLGIMRYSGFGACRNYDSFKVEAGAIELKVEQTRNDPDVWRRTFLDLVAVAFGLSLESWVVGDSQRLRSWLRWWKAKHLLFSNWPVGDLAARGALDRWILVTLEQLDVPFVNPVDTGLQHLLDYVLTRTTMKFGEGTSEEYEGSTTGYSQQELAWIFLAIRDGNRPDRKDVASIVLDSKLPPDVYEALSELMKIRWE
nr:hypothetical protein [Rhodoferax sp.]